MKCEEFDLVAYLKGEMEGDEKSVADQHVPGCSRCKAELEKLDNTISVLQKTERLEPTQGFGWRVRQAFVAAHPEFIEHEIPHGEGLGWWAALKKQFSYTPAWALSVAVHILLLAIGMILLVEFVIPPDDGGSAWVSPKKDSDVPEWDEEWDSKTPKGGRVIGDWKDNPDREFTHDPHDVIKGDKWDERNFRENPFDPKIWQPPQVARIDNVINVHFDTGARVSAKARDRLRNEGGGQGTDKVVRSALDWLKDRQLDEGSWQGPEHQGQNFKVGLTGLSLMAFLAEGQMPTKGVYKKTVSRAVQYLLKQQKQTGLIGTADQNYMYDHAIAATALLETYLMTKDEALRPAITAAVNFTIKAQNRNGGWGYTAESTDNDTSVMGWQIVLLRLYRTVDSWTPVTALNQARIRLHAGTDPTTGKVGYRGRGQYPHREFAMTAVGMFGHMMSRPIVDEHLVDLQATVLLSEGKPRVELEKRKFRSNNLYYWFFASLAMFQKGGQAWSTWNQRLVKDLVGAQQENGSWPADFDKWAEYGGQVYTTAMSALILQTYYRYPRFIR